MSKDQPQLRLATRMSRLGTETAFEVLAKARMLEAQGKSVIHLEIGEPDFDTPANIVEADVSAFRGGWRTNLRFSIANSIENIAEALNRIEAWAHANVR